MVLDIKTIITAVAEHAGLDVSMLLMRNRTRALVRVRQQSWWLCRRIRPDVSYPRLGKICGGYDHTTILWGVSAVDERRRADPFERAELDALLATIAPGGPEVLVAHLDSVDERLLGAVLTGRSLESCASYAKVSRQVAHSRLTVFAEACALAIGRGLISADRYSHKPDALLAPEPVPAAIIALVTPAAAPVAVEVSPLVALRAPEQDIHTASEPQELPVAERSRCDNPGRPAPSEEAKPPTRSRDVTGGAPVGLASTFHPSAARTPRRQVVMAETPKRSASSAPRVFARLPGPPAVAFKEKDCVSDSDRALIEAAIAAGKVTKVNKDDGTELVYDSDSHSYARYPRDQLEFVPERGWRKSPSARTRQIASKGARGKNAARAASVSS